MRAELRRRHQMKAIVPLDGSDNSLRIFTTVRALLALQPAIEIHLLSVVDPKSIKGQQDHTVSDPPAVSFGRTSVSAPLPRVVESHGEALDRAHSEGIAALADLGAKEIPQAATFTHVVFSGSPADVIKQLGDEIEADVIVMATHGRSGLSHMLAGSVTEAVIRTSTRPVLVQGPAAH